MELVRKVAWKYTQSQSNSTDIVSIPKITIFLKKKVENKFFASRQKNGVNLKNLHFPMNQYEWIISSSKILWTEKKELENLGEMSFTDMKTVSKVQNV